MRPRELRALLDLKLQPGVGDVRLRVLLRRHASAVDALQAYRKNPREALGRPDSVGSQAVEMAVEREVWAERIESAVERDRRAERVERAAQWIERTGVAVVLERQRRYPPRLRHLHQPPPVLFVLGQLSLLRAPAVAVVGTRQHTEYGGSTARMLAGGLARAGLVVISGMARGIDRIAHEAALNVGGLTVGVLGCGLDVAYPPEHQELQRLVARSGVLLSEFMPAEPPLHHNFPKRNRVIAALPLAVIVVEARQRSGALITGNHALDLGREVFAVPGPIGRDTSVGTNALIRDGAALVTSVADVLEVLPGEFREQTGVGRAAGANVAPACASVFSVLGPESIHVDEVAARVGASSRDVLVTLFELELDGLVQQLPGMRFARIETAERKHAPAGH